MVNFFWNLIYHAKQPTSIRWHNTQASPRLYYDPQFSWICQHQCDIYNRKSLITSPLPSALLAHQLQFMFLNVKNEFPMWSIRLVVMSFGHAIWRTYVDQCYCCYYSPTQQSCWVVYWFHSVPPSVPPSVHPFCIPCPLCSTYSSGWTQFIFIHLIKQLLNVCHV